jgi:hypothetical protein
MPCAYWDDINKKDQERAFLDGASAPLVRNEDGPTIMATTAPAFDEDDGTYKPQVSELLPSPPAQHSPLQVRRYQREIRLRRWAGRCPGTHPRAFWLAHANEDPRLLAEEVTE